MLEDIIKNASCEKKNLIAKIKEGILDEYCKFNISRSIEIAQIMLLDGMSIESVKEYTHLSEAEIQNLYNHLEDVLSNFDDATESEICKFIRLLEIIKPSNNYNQTEYVAGFFKADRIEKMENTLKDVIKNSKQEKQNIVNEYKEGLTKEDLDFLAEWAKDHI